jgi:hypothetical protein
MSLCGQPVASRLHWLAGRWTVDALLACSVIHVDSGLFGYTYILVWFVGLFMHEC